METIILKFGGSSVADNIRLNIVAEKIISLKKSSEKRGSSSISTRKNDR